jgi:hypothetical protein
LNLHELITSEYADLKVMSGIGVPWYGSWSEDDENDEINAMKASWRAHLWGEATLLDDSKFWYCNKSTPHAKLDMMLVQSDDDIRVSIDELSQMQACYMLARCYDFVRYISDNKTAQKFGTWNSHVHFAYNTDRETIDRESTMATKRAHVHMSCIDLYSIENLTGSKTQFFNEIDSFHRRRVIDVLTPIGAKLIKFLVEENNLFRYHTARTSVEFADIGYSLPPGFLILLKNGWDTLCDVSLVHDLRYLHCLLQKCYDMITTAIVEVSTVREPWIRPTLKPLKDRLIAIENLGFPKDIVKDLAVLVGHLKNSSPRLVSRFQSHYRTRVSHMPLAGLSYATSFFALSSNKQDSPLIGSDQVFCNIQLKLFSDIGGAGLICCSEHQLIELARKQGLYTPREQLDRMQFQLEFMHYEHAVNFSLLSNKITSNTF